VARGYLGQDSLTAAKFFVDPQGTRWFRSGDLGRWSLLGGAGGAEGAERQGGVGHTKKMLEVLGRIDLQVEILKNDENSQK